MGVSVRKAMQIGGLQQCKVVAGEQGLDRTIDYITVMEVPDVIQWLKGNDLLLTSLYAIKEDEEAIGRLVDQLDEVGSSALAIKTQRYVTEIPEAIIEAGNRLHLPIIQIEGEVSYLDIMTPLMELLLRSREADNEALEPFFQWITELAMGGKGIQPLVEAVQQMTENPITVGSDIPSLDSLHKGRDVAPLTLAQKNELKTAKRSIRMQRLLDNQEISCIVTPLLFNGTLYGDVTCWQTMRDFRERDLIVLDRMVLLLALEFLKAITKADVEQTFKDDFLSEVLQGNIKDKEEAISRAALFGWDLRKNYQVLSIAFAPRASEYGEQQDPLTLQEEKRKLLRKIKEIFRFDAHKIIDSIQRDVLVVLYPIPREILKGEPKSKRPRLSDGQEETIRVVADSLIQQLAQEFEDMKFVIGVGRFHPGLEGIHISYMESMKAIKLSKPISRDSGSIHYEDLGIYRILSPFADQQEKEAIYAETIGKLVDYDRSNNSNLVTSLSEYFAHNCVLSETASKLFVHVNTMKYRLQKIEQLTGCSIHDAEERLLLHIGLKLHSIL